jgi:hypothetical protein
MRELYKRVEEYLKYLEQDRQWPRRHRIAHAKMMLDKTKSMNPPFFNWRITISVAEQVKFWRAIIKANED